MTETKEDRVKRLNREKFQRYCNKNPAKVKESIKKYKQKKEDEECLEVFNYAMNNTENEIRKLIIEWYSLDKNDKDFVLNYNEIFGKLLFFVDMLEIRDGPENKLVKLVKGLPKSCQITGLGDELEILRANK